MGILVSARCVPGFAGEGDVWPLDPELSVRPQKRQCVESNSSSVFTAFGRASSTSRAAQATLRHRDLRAYRTALAGDQGMDSRRRTRPILVQPTPETFRTRPGMVRPNLNMESSRGPAQRWPHPGFGIHLTAMEAQIKAAARISQRNSLDKRAG